jgi:small-conductance mechanosensitive channel
LSADDGLVAVDAAQRSQPVKPAAHPWTAGALAGGLFIVAGLVAFVVAPVVRTSLSRELGLVAMILSGLVAAWFAARFSRGHKESAPLVLVSVIGGVVCGVLALVVIGVVYWVVAVIWFVHFSHFAW